MKERLMKTFVILFSIGLLLTSPAIKSGGASAAGNNDGLVYVKGGTFEMGNPYERADEDEKLIHTIRLSDYWFGSCEVTAGEFREFVEASGYVTTAERIGNAMIMIGKKVEKPGDGSWNKPYFRQHDGHPAVCVSWWDAVAYCNWRSAKEGLVKCYSISADSLVTWNRAANGYRLTTEAEWEFAGRNRGQNIKYAWGDSLPLIDGKPAANTRDEAAFREWELNNYWEGCDDGYAYTAPVDTFAANALGIYGISGNVYEWCWDWYSETYYGESPVDDPAGPPSGTMHACRDAGFSCPIYQEVV
ncbi:MAG: hypothetical protein EHM12_07240, partial [Dehalococcoidia bacterium]